MIKLTWEQLKHTDIQVIHLVMYSASGKYDESNWKLRFVAVMGLRNIAAAYTKTEVDYLVARATIDNSIYYRGLPVRCKFFKQP